MLVRARQSFQFQFFRQKTWFLENNRALPKFLYGILHYLTITTKLKQNQSIKKQSHINHASQLKLGDVKY